MLKTDYIVYLFMYINIKAICKNNTVNHLTFGK